MMIMLKAHNKAYVRSVGAYAAPFDDKRPPKSEPMTRSKGD